MKSRRIRALGVAVMLVGMAACGASKPQPVQSTDLQPSGAEATAAPAPSASPAPAPTSPKR